MRPREQNGSPGRLGLVVSFSMHSVRRLRRTGGSPCTCRSAGTQGDRGADRGRQGRCGSLGSSGDFAEFLGGGGGAHEGAVRGPGVHVVVCGQQKGGGTGRGGAAGRHGTRLGLSGGGAARYHAGAVEVFVFQRQVCGGDSAAAVLSGRGGEREGVGVEINDGHTEAEEHTDTGRQRAAAAERRVQKYTDVNKNVL